MIGMDPAKKQIILDPEAAPKSPEEVEAPEIRVLEALREMMKRDVRARKLSPVEVVDHPLKADWRLNAKLNAYLTGAEAEARSAAQAAEAALGRGAAATPLLV